MSARLGCPPRPMFQQEGRAEFSLRRERLSLDRKLRGSSEERLRYVCTSFFEPSTAEIKVHGACRPSLSKTAFEISLSRSLS